MDSTKFQEAQQAYDAGDYRNAAKLFLASAGKGTVGNGAAYHMAGNALMRLRRHSDAVTVYGHALKDDAYDRRGAVHANLGAAHVALGELSEAVAAYEAALEEPGYPTPYKAWQGIGAAHLERGRGEEAAVAYRRAALDEKNPNPGKALVNLGVCFMALNRPSDAVDAYKAALGFEAFGGRGRALANLGMAYVAMGQFDEAVKSFEKATQLHGHSLSDAAQKAYETAVANSTPPRETVDGWETGEIQPVDMEPAPQGWGTGELSGLETGTATGAFDQVGVPASPAAQPGLPHDDAADRAAAQLGFGDDAAVKDFFSVTEEEMKKRDREARRANKSGRRGFMRNFVVTVIVGSVLAVALAAAYYFGLGWPDQATTIKGLFVAYSTGEPVEEYWVAVPKTDVKREMAKVPPVKVFRIDGIDRGREVSKARVTVTPEKGAPMQYLVILGREGVGWRVTGVDYNWRSTGS